MLSCNQLGAWYSMYLSNPSSESEEKQTMPIQKSTQKSVSYTDLLGDVVGEATCEVVIDGNQITYTVIAPLSYANLGKVSKTGVQYFMDFFRLTGVPVTITRDGKTVQITGTVGGFVLPK